MGRILIVDDEPHTRRVLALNLRQDNHDIGECAGVREARKSLFSDHFDAVLTDQKMPTVMASKYWRRRSRQTPPCRSS